MTTFSPIRIPAQALISVALAASMLAVTGCAIQAASSDRADGSTMEAYWDHKDVWNRHDVAALPATLRGTEHWIIPQPADKYPGSARAGCLLGRTV